MKLKLLAALSAAAMVLAATAAQAAGIVTFGLKAESLTLGRPIPYAVYTPFPAPPEGERWPVVYLLHGMSGADGDWFTWGNLGQILDRALADGRIPPLMVVAPGAGDSWYVDNPDPEGFGLIDTAFATDLVAAIDASYPTAKCRTGRAIGGVSMAGGAVLDLAIQAPGFYRAVGSYSGCAATSGLLGQAMVRSMVELRGGGNAANMWGSAVDPRWRVHDPMLNAERLRGTEVFVSSGNGLPGSIDNHDPVLVVPQTIGGSVVEMVTNACAAAFQSRLHSLGIPATFTYLSQGTHSWGLFETELRESWPVIGGAIGA